MCGICGLAGVETDVPPLEAVMLRAMTDAIEHRGPDEDGHHLGPGIAMGMRRLSIIDLASSHQPLCNEGGDVWTVFNGEIYNFRELRSELIARGHTLRSGGDTETIVHLYEERGSSFVESLRGMFAIAIWDERRRRLILTRDRMGVKPLYYALTPRGLAFASEVKSLLAGGLVEPRLDPMAAELFLAFGYVPGPRTLFDGVRKLAPATTLVWENGALAGETEYWTPWQEQWTTGASWQEDQERLLELLRSSVRARMVSDVPLGAMLSGGLDSSLVTALMAEASTAPVKTFSIGFTEDAQANELADARRVATRFGTDHHELLTSAVDHPSLIEDALWHLEEPITDLSFLGFLLLSRLAREHVTVALCGQAADELLGGYAKHAVASAATRVAGMPVPARRALAAAGARIAEDSRLGRGLRAISSEDDAERLLQMSRVVLEGQRRELLDPGFRSSLADAEMREVIHSRASGRGNSVLRETMFLDTKLALVDLMFMYFDKMSMATSLEVRVPFADHDVVSFCMGLPDDRCILRGRRKEILKRVARGLLDDATIDKKKRGFFRAASSTWLNTHRDGIVREVLLDERARARGVFAPQAAERLIAQSQGTRRAGEPLLAVLLLELWHRRFVDSDGAGRRLAHQVTQVAS
ncbi:MAG TPA: asparagine synthase (glutamine-hydrolyzing) [Solirubrobacteraceae bacterium]|nr:asparagine synthase (glutamine-hydrolyzing) [Solirubrobacteraceae bacterium]